MEVVPLCKSVLNSSTCESLGNAALPISAIGAVALGLFLEHHFRFPQKEESPLLQGKKGTISDAGWDLKVLQTKLKDCFDPSKYSDEGIFFIDNENKLSVDQFAKEIQRFANELKAETCFSRVQEESKKWLELVSFAKSMALPSYGGETKGDIWAKYLVLESSFEELNNTFLR